MSREVHVRFWESAGVRFLRATHLPLYRQEGICGRAGLAIPRSTLSAWATLLINERTTSRSCASRSFELDARRGITGIRSNRSRPRYRIGARASRPGCITFAVGAPPVVVGGHAEANLRQVLGVFAAGRMLRDCHASGVRFESSLTSKNRRGQPVTSDSPELFDTTHAKPCCAK